jgi:hypothetical protein
MKRWIALLATGLVTLAVAFSIFGGAPPASVTAHDDPPAVDVIPVVTVRADSPMEVQLALEPATDRPVRYLFQDGKEPIYGVAFRRVGGSGHDYPGSRPREK